MDDLSNFFNNLTDNKNILFIFGISIFVFALSGAMKFGEAVGKVLYALFS